MIYIYTFIRKTVVTNTYYSKVILGVQNAIYFKYIRYSTNVTQFDKTMNSSGPGKGSTVLQSLKSSDTNEMQNGISIQCIDLICITILHFNKLFREWMQRKICRKKYVIINNLTKMTEIVRNSSSNYINFLTRYCFYCYLIN